MYEPGDSDSFRSAPSSDGSPGTSASLRPSSSRLCSPESSATGISSGLGWVDAFLNAAMLLGGMGPVDVPKSSGGKLFAGIDALYAGMVLLVVVGILLTPVVHRILHKFHIAETMDADEANEEASRPRR